MGPYDLTQFKQKNNLNQYDKSLNLLTADCADLHSLTVIDMSLYESNKKELTKHLIDQMEWVGFCILKNVPGFDEDDLKNTIMAFHNENNSLTKDCAYLIKRKDKNTFLTTQLNPKWRFDKNLKL